MRIDKRLLVLVALVILIGIGCLTWSVLHVSEQERLEAFLLQMAEDLPESEAESYRRYIDLETLGFRLDYRQIKAAFGRDDEALWLKTAKVLVNMIRGSKVTVKRIDIELKERRAKVRMTLFWERGRAREAIVEKCLVGLDADLARTADGWKVTRLKAFPERDVFRGAF